ncbi:SDR family NAD(P)-dependent oxidoreductase [Embleya sp. NPDC020886]|uniref:SDR family NAD(P)-dependent oxidoreductase n=1 Tax=Embleya sp. NPDC020886 TaxID=3363980 RepID=UPI0037B78FCE
MGNEAALVTGTSSGIGLHTAIGLAAEGTRVVATMRDTAKADRLRAEAADRGVEVAVRRPDVTDLHHARWCLDAVAAELGVVDREQALLRNRLTPLRRDLADNTAKPAAARDLAPAAGQTHALPAARDEFAHPGVPVDVLACCSCTSGRQLVYMLFMSSVRKQDSQGGTAQDVTYRWLKRHISELPRDGGTFLTESEVALAAGTSRTPVREALLRLEAEGFVQIMPKKGAFVPPVSDADVRAVMEARALIEDWCVRRVVSAAPEFFDELDRLLGEQEALIDDPVGFIDCDRAFHRAIVRQGGNPVLADFYESLRERQVRMGLRAVANEATRTGTVLTEHAAIVAALRTGDADRVGDSLATHLSSTLVALHLPAPAHWSGVAGAPSVVGQS